MVTRAFPSDPSDAAARVVVDADVAAAAERLRRAATSGKPCTPVRNLIGAGDVATAYRVQSALTRDRTDAGARIVGRKIGLTSPAVQAQLGVDQPDFGVLFDDMGYLDGDVLPTARLLQPRVEAEIAFVLSADLPDGPFDAATVRQAVAYCVAALEVVDSRIAGWDISVADTIADNASSGLYVLGPVRRTLAEVEPADVEMTMTVDGEVVSTGVGRACLGDPLAALAWLATRAAQLGEPLRRGQLVLSGALGPMHPVRAGAVVRAEVSGLGVVTASFSAPDAVVAADGGQH